MSLGALAILNPWLLAALATLPVIYWLLRTVPPRPQQVDFPPTRILVGLENREKTPAKTPWWLTLIRLLSAALLILALAEPVLNPAHDKAMKGSGPVAIVIDNGWSSGTRWAERVAMVERLIAEAEAQSRPVAIIATAAATKAPVARIEAPNDARSTAAALLPQPFAPDRGRVLDALQTALQNSASTGSSVVWLTDGIDHDTKAAGLAERMAQLANGGSFTVIADGAGAEPLGLFAGMGSGGKLEAKLLRADGPPRDGQINAYSARGERLGETRFSLGAGATSASVVFELPLELRNQVTRLEIAGERSAGSVSLLDGRSQWQRVGLVSGESREKAQPLLAPLYYIQKAVAPFAEVVVTKDSNLAGGIDDILKQSASVLVLADIGTLSGELKERVGTYVRKGGVLVRFAGPRLEKGGDDLLPVPLRAGGRTLGGALSWSTPQQLAAFDEGSLFAGLTVPPEVTVNRQVLADPASLGPDTAVWARLMDGTPLVTSVKRGEGHIVLFHITGNSDWSNLPISGLFVDMLQRIAQLGHAGGVGGDAATADNGTGTTASTAPAVLAPVQTLDGFGALKAPPPTAQPLSAAAFDKMSPSLDHPPGYYGTSATPRAMNVLNAKSKIVPLPSLPAAAERRGYESEAATPLKPWLLAAALGLLFIDIVAVVLLQMGGLARGRRKPGAAVTAASVALIAAGLCFHTPDARAQPAGEAEAPEAAGGAGEPVPVPPRTAPRVRTAADAATDTNAQAATSKVTFGFVLTGEEDIDNTSRLGLSGLGKVLAARTAVEPGEPIAINILTDEIAFFPAIYWPVVDNAQTLPEPVLAKIDAYMKEGGLIIFDTRDYGLGVPDGFSLDGKGGTALQRIIGQLDIPRLEPVPEQHVLTKAFYLLRAFPGRWDGGQLWVEAIGEPDSEASRKARVADGVTSIMITSNDFAAAWALDDKGLPLYPVVPGGENQREMAFRSGVNIVMHALTGNYKADQVHVPALLERLGQ